MNRVQKHNLKRQLSNVAFVALVLFVTAMLIMGPTKAEMDAETAHYCDMVEQGAWPDYKGTYEEFCK